MVWHSAILFRFFVPVRIVSVRMVSVRILSVQITSVRVRIRTVSRWIACCIFLAFGDLPHFPFSDVFRFFSIFFWFQWDAFSDLICLAVAFFVFSALQYYCDVCDVRFDALPCFLSLICHLLHCPIFWNSLVCHTLFLFASSNSCNSARSINLKISIIRIQIWIRIWIEISWLFFLCDLQSIDILGYAAVFISLQSSIHSRICCSLHVFAIFHLLLSAALQDREWEWCMARLRMVLW